MATTSGIRLDSLLHSLKEMQNEKQCLEQKLNERISYGQAVERRLEGYNTKLAQMQDMHQKLSEMQKVAKQKVQQTQQQVDSLHELNQAQSNRVNELNSLIEQEKDKSQDIVRNFEARMSDLARKMRSSRKFYNHNKLQERIGDVGDRWHKKHTAAETNSEEVNSLTSTMENMQLTSPGIWTLLTEIPPRLRIVIWDMLLQEETAVRDSMMRLHTDQQEVCDLLQESTVSIPQ